MAENGMMTIGALLRALQEEFPELTISKIRFLEHEGLVKPMRTPSGYRKFSQEDLQAIKFILRLQKDKYLPLKVIKDKMEEMQQGRVKAGDLSPEQGATDAAIGKVIDELEDSIILKENAIMVLGVTEEFIKQLEDFDLICSHTGQEGRYYEREDIKIIKIVSELSNYGIEPRHLRMYSHFTDREAMFFEQLMMGKLIKRDPQSRKNAASALDKLSEISSHLKDSLLRNRIKKMIEGK